MDVTRQEPELLASLHRRAHQDDPGHLLGRQERHRLRHGEIGLAGASRTDPEHDVVALDRVDVPTLIDALGRHLPLTRWPERGAKEVVAQLDGRILRDQMGRALHVPLGKSVPLADEGRELPDASPGLGHVD